MVEGLTRLTMPGSDDTGATPAPAPALPPALVIDPTCGGGAFLLAAADRLVAMGLEPAEAATRLAGMDLDASAIEATPLGAPAVARRPGGVGRGGALGPRARSDRR